MKKLPFRLGTTSYIIPDDILPNVRWLAGKVDDVELVLFEVDDQPNEHGLNNLPDPAAIAGLRELSKRHDLSYTVHLPLDLRLAAPDGEQHASIDKARRVIELTRPLQPWAYVLHLDGRELIGGSSPAEKEGWNDQAVQALELLAGWAGDPRLLAVENLERYALDFIDEAVRRAGTSRCIDIGHLWLDGHDPLPYLEKHLERARVLHIHGIGTRDHQSLMFVREAELERVMGWLVRSGYAGVVTMEVFGVEDFEESRRRVEELYSVIP